MVGQSWAINMINTNRICATRNNFTRSLPRARGKKPDPIGKPDRIVHLSRPMENIHLNFDSDSQALMSVLLAFIMYGVALELKWEKLKEAFIRPKAMVIGLISQFVVLPLLTFALVWLWQPMAGIAMGLMLVAACPGGNISNFFSSLAKADVGLSVSLTAVATFACLFMTPFNFSLYTKLHPLTADLAREVSLNPVELFGTVFVILIIPVLLGIVTRKQAPKFTSKVERPIRLASMLIFVGFV